MLRYVPCPEAVLSVDGDHYISYGIVILDEAGHEVAHVSDVSTRKAAVAELCSACERCRIDPIHLRDVIEDMLYT